MEKLLPLVESKVVSGRANEFRAPLLQLIDICSLAPVRDRANEEFTEGGLMSSSSLFRVLGGTLWSPDKGIMSATANALEKIAAGNDPTRPNTPDEKTRVSLGECRDDLRPKPRDINQALLLGCGVVTSAVACLSTIVSSLLESLADPDDSSLESSSFGCSEEDGYAQAVSLGVDNRGMLSGSEGDVWLADIGSEKNDGEAKACPEKTQVTQTGEGTAVSDIASKYSVLVSLLQFVRELSTSSKSSAAMVEVGLVFLMVQVLRAVRGVRDPALSVVVEVLWNCLEYSQNAMKLDPPADSRTSLVRKARKSNAAFALSTWDGVSALRGTVETLLEGGFRNKDKELRNEAVIVASLLAGNGRSHPIFRLTGMLQLLLRYATAIETGLADGDPQAAESEARTLAMAVDERSAGSSGVDGKGVPELGVLADPRNFATTTEVDMELKLLLWSLLAELSKRDTRNLEVVKASPLMETLLMYMDLVVEEGSLAHSIIPGMNRSVALASMPPVVGCQAGFTESDTCTLTGANAGVGGSNAASVTENNMTPGPTSLLDSGPSYSEKDVHALDNEASATSDVLEQEGSTLSEAANGRQTAGLIQLYVPAMVFRLPVTSIQHLQGQAMATLLVLAPKIPKKFQALGGHLVTLRLLDRLGSRPENQRLVKAATKMLATVVGLPGLKEELGRMDGVRIMLDRFSDEGKREPHGGGGISSGGGGIEGGGGEGKGDLRTDIVVILCRLCNNCPGNQEAFRKADGVPTMMGAIKAYCRARSEAKQQEGAGGGTVGGGGGKRSDGEGSGKFSLRIGSGGDARGSGGSSSEKLDASLVHIVDCVWCAIVGNRRSEARLLQCEGLDVLLDLLELCPVLMRHQVRTLIR